MRSTLLLFHSYIGLSCFLQNSFILKKSIFSQEKSMIEFLQDTKYASVVSIKSESFYSLSNLYAQS